MAENLKLVESKVLAQLGLSEKNEWVLYDDKMKLLFSYIAENLDEDNILTTEELCQYEALLSAGGFLESDELTEQLKELEKNFPGMFDMTDESIEEMEREIEFLKKDTAEREDRIIRMEETQRKQEVSKVFIQKKIDELEFQEQVLKEECLGKARILEDLQKANQILVAQMKETYIQQQNPPCLLYQMPLDQHSHKLDQFTTQLEIFMRNRFNVTNFPEDAARDEDSIEAIVERKQQIIEIELQKFDDELTMAGFNSIIRNIYEFKQRFGGEVKDVRLIIEAIESDNDRLQVELDIIRKEASLMVEQRTEQKISKIFNEHFKAVNTHMLERLDAIKSVNDLSENVTLSSELLWVIMNLDIERLKNRVDNTEEMMLEKNDFTKRMRSMKVSATRNPSASLNEFFVKKLQDVLIENLPLERTDLPNLTSCLQEYIGFEEKTQRVVKACVTQENLSQIHQVMRQIENHLELLRDFVMNGPTNRPKLYDTKLLMQIFDREQKKIEIERAYEEAKSNFKKKIIDPSHDRFIRMERNLWIYFLSEPKKVLDCIKEVQKKAAEKGSVSFKAMNITLNKLN